MATDKLSGYAKRSLSLVIMIIGIALVVRSVLMTGTALTTGLVAGLAFVIYGLARFWYSGGSS